MIYVLEKVEKIVGNGESAQNIVLQKFSYTGSIELWTVLSVDNGYLLILFKLKVTAYGQLKVAQIMNFVFYRVENVEKKRKHLLQAVSSFLYNVS